MIRNIINVVIDRTLEFISHIVSLCLICVTVLVVVTTARLFILETADLSFTNSGANSPSSFIEALRPKSTSNVSMADSLEDILDSVSGSGSIPTVDDFANALFGEINSLFGGSSKGSLPSFSNMMSGSG